MTFHDHNVLIIIRNYMIKFIYIKQSYVLFSNFLLIKYLKYSFQDTIWCNINRFFYLYRKSFSGVNVRIPLLNYHMHSKIAIIDGWKVMAGSVNWTVQGMYGNWDNLVITSQKDIVKDAMETFDLIWYNPSTMMFS